VGCPAPADARAPLVHVHTVAPVVTIPPIIPMIIPTTSSCVGPLLPVPDPLELPFDPATVEKLYVVAAGVLAARVLASVVFVVTLGLVGAKDVEPPSYTVSTLVLGAPGNVTNVVATDHTAGDGEDGVYVTVIESANA